MRLKILITTFTFPPNRDGVAEASASLAFGLAERGHEVVVATGHSEPVQDRRPHPKLHVRYFELAGNGHSIRDSASMQQFLIEEDPDLVICQCWEVWSTALAELIFDRLRARKILVSHGYATHIWQSRWRPPFGLGVWLRGLPKVIRLPHTMRLYDRVVFLSGKRDWNRFFDHHLAKLTGYAGCRVIPNGTEAYPMRGSVNEFKQKFIRGDGLNLCFVANYSPRKNQARAVRVFRKARLQDATLVLIGSEFNPYTEEVRQLDLELQLEYPAGTVVFLEKLDQPTTLAAYTACDVFLLTADAETQPIVLLEAMAAGQPFVTTDVGCVTELPGGIVAKSERQLSSALRKLQDSPSLRAELGRKGRTAILEHFQKNQVLEAHSALIQELFH